ncbi:hypothetical protein JTB14_020793 [Gonioctena quinquepunctata]|nr:hypothetical protein JTB14_020793 [Gonioctena quinquepunctata]
MGRRLPDRRKHLSKQTLPCKLEVETKRKLVKKLFLVEVEDNWVRSAPRCNPPLLTMTELNEAAGRLKTGKTPGPDKITPGALKEAVNAIPAFTLEIYDKQLQEMKIWKTAKVVLIPKANSAPDEDGIPPHSPICLLESRELSAAISDHDIIVLTETWLHENILDEELGLSQYDIYRTDPSVLTSQKYRRGGVLIAVKNFSSNVIALNKDNVEQIFVNVYAYGEELVIGGIYLSPSSCQDLYEDHCATVDSVMERFPKKKLLLYGDYNLPNVEWYNDELGVSAIFNNNNTAQILIESLAFHNLI